MKRIVAILAALLLTAAASAQENHFRIGVGGYPWVPSLLVNGIGCEPVWNYPATLGALFVQYEEGTYTTGNISAEYAWDFRNRFSVSVSASTDIIWTVLRDPVTSKKTDTVAGALVSLMSKARYSWVSRNVVKMYSSVSIGVIAGYAEREVVALPGIQLTPVGIEVGRTLFGFAEVGIGTSYAGGMVGVGYRF